MPFLMHNLLLEKCTPFEWKSGRSIHSIQSWTTQRYKSFLFSSENWLDFQFEVKNKVQWNKIRKKKRKLEQIFQENLIKSRKKENNF